MTDSDGVLNIQALIVEDDPVWQTIHKNTLNANQCPHLVTDDIDIALNHVTQNYVQLAIIDLDLSRAKKYQQVPSTNREEGWQLVNTIRQNGWLNKMVVCVVSHWSDISGLSAFTGKGVFSIDQMRPNLASGVEVQGVIYFSKNEYQPQEFWQRIHAELHRKQLMSNLKIEDGRIVNMLAVRMTRNLIEHIESRAEHSQLDNQDVWIRSIYENQGLDTLNSRIESEIENLLLLSVNRNSTEIDLRRIGNGFSKASVVRVSSLLINNWTNEVIIKLGYHREIDNEWEAYNDFVEPFIVRRPTAQFGPKTPMLSSIVYTYVGDSESFEDIYKNCEQEELNLVLEDLFKKACEPWYRANQQSKIDASQYMQYLHCYPERFLKPLHALEQSTEAQGANLHESTIRFPNIDEDFLNPVQLLYPDQIGSFEAYPAFIGITHGDFNANNILVLSENDEYRTVMIDFARTSLFHNLRDFLQLETVIKFVLLESATLEERYELEAALLKQSSFAEIKSLKNSYQATGKNAKDLQRAFDTVCKIRELAWEVALHGGKGKPIYRFEQYHLGLFFLSLNTVRFLRSEFKPRESLTDGISPVQALHALLAAALLVDKLVVQ